MQYTYVTEDLKKKMKNLRREFHRYPETAWTEYRTAWRAAGELEKNGFQVYTGNAACCSDARMGLPSAAYLEACEQRALSEGVPKLIMERIGSGRTAVAGILKGKFPGPVRVLRFDMDALPVEEAETEKNRDYLSRHAGIMHACGHDGHMAAGLGLAEILGKNRDKIRGEIRLLFQPAEEGCRGARSLTEKGWLEGADELYCGHIGMGEKRLGNITACSGGFLATTKLDILFHGKPSHAAKAPEQGRNALLAAAVCTVNAYAISRSGRGEGRINIGRFSGGSGRNIIAGEARLEAETRGETSEINQYMKDSLERVARASAAMYGTACEFLEQGESRTAASSPALAEKCRRAAESMGPGCVYRTTGVFGASEDAAELMGRLQEQGGEAAYFLFGTPLSAEHHQPEFDFDEEVLAVMAEFYSRILLD